MADDDLTEIKISTARIEEQVKALAAATAMQHSNLSDQMKKLADKTTMDDIDGRVMKLESAQGWVVKGIIGTAATAIAAASGLTKKIGL